MTINRTTLLDLPLPVTGTESGTWGNITNNGLAQYVDIAVAGMNALTSSDFTAGALTISNTQGDSGGTNIAAGSAQYATIKVSSLATNSTITAPASNRSYRIINADSTYNLTIKASGQAGITFLPGQTGVVAFTGTDYEVVGVVNAASSTDNAVPRFDGTTGQIIQNSGVTIDNSGNLTTAGLNTSGQVVFNDAGADVDFRVESDTVENALFVDGATGNIGIGTGTPTSNRRLDAVISADASAGIRVVNSNAGTATSSNTSYNNGTSSHEFGILGTNYSTYGVLAASDAYIYASNNQNIAFGADGVNSIIKFGTGAGITERMRIDTSGNVGIGVTPSAWETLSGSRAIQFLGSSLYGYRDTNLILVQNAYFDGSFKYYASSIASGYYSIGSGAHSWYTAPSGTAGDAITFTQAMTLDASGNVGIGTSSPSNTMNPGLHIKSASGNSLILEKSTGAAIQFRSDATTIRATVTGINGADGLIIGTGAAQTERMRITSAGAVEIANGNLVFSTNGTGIDFSASAGGGATSSILDDYEEGTFTPAFSSSGAVFTYSVQQGAYTKIGRQVCFNIYLQLDGAQTLTANFVTITGLPFTSATISNLNVAMVCGIRLVNLTAGASILVGRLGSNSSSISLVEEGDNYATTSLNSNQLSNLSGQVMISGTYPAT
jgi:hypothetical protein